MKNKKQPLADLIVQMPPPANFRKLALDDEKEDPVEEFAKGQLQEQLLEQIGAKLDDYFALTGEPITAAITFGHHALEVAEILGGSGNNSKTSQTTVIQPRQKQREDEDEIFK